MKKVVKKCLSVLMLLSALLPTLSVAAQGKDLRVQIEVEVASLDPQIASDGTSIEVMANFIDGLLEMDKDGKMVPAMAESYEISEDQKVYTFKIRQDAKWSNGKPVTAHDFVFAWRRLVDPATASEYSFIAGTANIANALEIIEGKKDKAELGAVAKDDKTLEVTLTRPTPYFLSLMGFISFWPVNEEFYNSTNGQFATSPETVLSNGAFILDTYQPAATTIKLKKNPDYYNASAVSLDSIEFQVIKDSQQAVLGFQTGQLDLTAISGEQVALYQNDPAFLQASKGYLWYIAPNQKEGDLQNVNLRLAIGQAFDRKVITESVLKDGSIPADFFIPYGLCSSEAGVDYREDAGTGLITTDVAKAQEHFEKAKQELGKDKFTLGLLVEDTEASLNVAQSLEAQIEQNLPGVDIQIEQTPKKNRLQRMQEGNYQLGLTRWGPDYPDPTTYLQLLTTENSYNLARYANSEFDAAYKEIMEGSLLTDISGRWEKMKEMEKLAMSEAAVLPVYQSAAALLVKPGLEGVIYHTVGTPRTFKYVKLP